MRILITTKEQAGQREGYDRVFYRDQPGGVLSLLRSLKATSDGTSVDLEIASASMEAEIRPWLGLYLFDPETDSIRANL